MPLVRMVGFWFFFFSSRRRHTRCGRDWSSTCALPISNLLVDARQKEKAVKIVEDSIAYVKTNVENERDEIQMLSGLQRKQRQLLLQGEIAPEITKIGRASCREREKISVVAVSGKKVKE